MNVYGVGRNGILCLNTANSRGNMWLFPHIAHVETRLAHNIHVTMMIFEISRVGRGFDSQSGHGNGHQSLARMVAKRFAHRAIRMNDGMPPSLRHVM